MGVIVLEFFVKLCWSVDYGRSIEIYVYVGSRYGFCGLKNEGIVVLWSFGYFNLLFVIYIGVFM